jgi:hypothetical protein
VAGGKERYRRCGGLVCCRYSLPFERSFERCDWVPHQHRYVSVHLFSSSRDTDDSRSQVLSSPLASSTSSELSTRTSCPSTPSSESSNTAAMRSPLRRRILRRRSRLRTGRLREGLRWVFFPFFSFLSLTFFLQFENFSARYSEDGEDVLHSLTLSIKPGEKIGVVGKSGCGKSSLCSSFSSFSLSPLLIHTHLRPPQLSPSSASSSPRKAPSPSTGGSSPTPTLTRSGRG